MKSVLTRTRKDEAEEARLERIKAVDLITFPKDVSGTNCGNCKWYEHDYCTHPAIQSEVTDQMCCNMWDRPGTTRQWEKKDASK